jgi:hypothetical protein
MFSYLISWTIWWAIARQKHRVVMEGYIFYPSHPHLHLSLQYTYMSSIFNLSMKCISIDSNPYQKQCHRQTQYLAKHISCCLFRKMEPICFLCYGRFEHSLTWSHPTSSRRLCDMNDTFKILRDVYFWFSSEFNCAETTTMRRF